MSHTGRRNSVGWLVRARTRETHLHQVRGPRMAPHNRSVERWSKWKTHRSCPDVHTAIAQLAQVRRQLGLAEVAVWHNRVRLDDKQLAMRAREDLEQREGGEP